MGTNTKSVSYYTTDALGQRLFLGRTSGFTWATSSSFLICKTGIIMLPTTWLFKASIKYSFARWSLKKRRGKCNPLQYSCLEYPVDRGTWWAAVHGVAQSWTWLKRLSMHACIGEGNGNPLQCSCLEDPRDGGAWWAAVYGVAQSQTRLKRLSSSSSSREWEGG